MEIGGVRFEETIREMNITFVTDCQLSGVRRLELFSIFFFSNSIKLSFILVSALSCGGTFNNSSATYISSNNSINARESFKEFSDLPLVCLCVCVCFSRERECMKKR
jgi:hypothetical protein